MNVAYLRVSTDDQANGLEAQRATITAYAAKEGVSLASWHVDEGVSGGSSLEAREGLLGAIRDLRKGGLLIIAKRDRLARDVLVAATIEAAVSRLGARVVSADGAGNGVEAADAFMRSVLDAVAAYERALIRQRTKSALAAKRARGELVGTVPYGWWLGPDGVHLEPHPEEQTMIARVVELRQGGATIAAICRLRIPRLSQRTQVARVLARAGG